LVNQVCFVADVPSKHIGDEKFGKIVAFTKRGHHSRLFNPEKRAVGDRRGRHHAKGLACHASLAKKIAVVQNSNDRCLPLLGDDCQLYPSLLEIEDSASRFSLHEDIAFLTEFDDFSLGSKGPEEALHIERRWQPLL